MDKYFIWIHYERLHNHNKAKHNKTAFIFLGIYCRSASWATFDSDNSLSTFWSQSFIWTNAALLLTELDPWDKRLCNLKKSSILVRCMIHFKLLSAKYWPFVMASMYELLPFLWHETHWQQPLTYWDRWKMPPFCWRHIQMHFLELKYLNINKKISLWYVFKSPIDNISALGHIMAWRRLGDKPLNEPIMVSLQMHICVTLPQWVDNKLAPPSMPRVVPIEESI